MSRQNLMLTVGVVVYSASPRCTEYFRFYSYSRCTYIRVCTQRTNYDSALSPGEMA